MRKPHLKIFVGISLPILHLDFPKLGVRFKGLGFGAPALNGAFSRLVDLLSNPQTLRVEASISKPFRG